MSSAVLDIETNESAAPTQASSDREVNVRRISFFNRDSKEVARHFTGDDILMSHVTATLSAVFPEGEDYFVRSVRHFRDQITDPVLKKQVQGFIGQEATHGREHRTFNARLAELGYPTVIIDRFTGNRLKFDERHAPARYRLAVTAALEHYTATLAEKLLRSEEAQAMFTDPEVLNLLLWHAIEESEHKAVAFDVYQAVCGNDKLRIRMMRVITVGFIGGCTFWALFSLAKDPAAWRNPRRVIRSFRNLRNSPWLTKEVSDRIRDYNRPGFHPDDHDATELLAAWRTKLFGQAGTLNDHLNVKAS